jgi:hypothetical protein
MRALLCSILLALPLFSGCVGAPKPADNEGRRPYGLLQHPLIDAAAQELVAGAQSAINAGIAPDKGDRWMIPPIVGEEGVWEASALCFAIAALEGRVRPVQPTQKLASVPAVQAWLRAENLSNVIWVVEASGLIQPELKLVICTGERVWRSPVIKVSVPKDQRFTWPFSPVENPPLARTEVGGPKPSSSWTGRSTCSLARVYGNSIGPAARPSCSWGACGRGRISAGPGSHATWAPNPIGPPPAR